MQSKRFKNKKLWISTGLLLLSIFLSNYAADIWTTIFFSMASLASAIGMTCYSIIAIKNHHYIKGISLLSVSILYQIIWITGLIIGIISGAQ